MTEQKNNSTVALKPAAQKKPCFQHQRPEYRGEENKLQQQLQQQQMGGRIRD